MPSARVSTITSTKPGRLTSVRKAIRRSFEKPAKWTSPRILSLDGWCSRKVSALVAPAILHDYQQALSVGRQHRDVFQRVAIHHQQIRRRTFADRSEPAGLAQWLRIHSAGGAQNIDRWQNLRAQRELGRLAHVLAPSRSVPRPIFTPARFMISRPAKARSPMRRNFSMLTAGKPSFSPSSAKAESVAMMGTAKDEKLARRAFSTYCL